MAAAARSDASDTSDREIVATRIFDAPRELVFKVWTDPAHVAQWWGPNGFTITTRQMDVRPGGVWRFEMHGPDGRNYPNRITYVEVVRPERLVYKHDDDGAGQVSGFDVTATFEELPGGRTKLTMRALFPSAAAKRYVVEMHNATEGMNQTLARLGEKLSAMNADGGQEFVISRMFDAPRERVFEVWTKQEHLVKWFGPRGSTMPVGKLDLRVGGTFHFQLRSGDGQEMWARFVFRVIDAPQRLVFVHSFSDPAGNLARCPFIPTWPMELLTTVTFDQQQQGGPTLVTIRWSTLNATEVERQTFAAAHDSMQQGWTGTFEQLADYLAKAM